MATLDLQGNSAEVVSSDGHWIVLETASPAPVGSTLRATLVGSPNEYLIKVRDCRRWEGGSHPCFRVEGRLVNLSRAARQQLLAALEAPHHEPPAPR